MPATISANLTTTGATAATGILDLPVGRGDTMAQFGISGTYGTVTFKFYSSIDGTNFDEQAAIRNATGLVVTSTVSPSDNTAYNWNVPCAGMATVRLYITAIASGTVAATAKSFAVVGAPGLGYSPAPTNSGTFSGATFNGTASAFAIMPTFPTATVAAAGTVQANAAAVTTGFTLVTGSTNAGVLLPAAAAGLICIIKNNVAGNMKIWPNTSDAINAIAADGNFTVATLTTCMLVAYDATTWYSVPLVAS